MITETHAALLAQSLHSLLGAPDTGTVAYLRCLPSEIVDGLAAEPAFEVHGFAVYAVVDREDVTARLITTDRAVELREDKGQPLVLLIDPRRAGAGLDGIYSAGREIAEQELLGKANELARKELGHGRIGFARDAVRAARRLGRRSLITPWQEFDFLVAASASVEVMGGAITRLGLWPIAIEGRPKKSDIDLSAAMVNRLLFNPDATAGPAARIAALMLEEATPEQRNGLEQFLRMAATLDLIAAMRRLEYRPELWLNVLKPRFASDQLTAIQLVPWRNERDKLLGWSGLQESEDGKPRFRIGPGALDQRKVPRLEVRWRTAPDDLSKGTATYQVDVMAADETLSTRTVAHKQASPQKAVFTADDFEELDEAARFEAFVRVSALGQDTVKAQDSEEFLLEYGPASGPPESTSGKMVRCFVEGAIELPTVEDFRKAVENLPAGAHEDRKGYIAWRAAPGASRTFKVPRPPLIAEMEASWHAHDGYPGRFHVRVRAEGSPVASVEYEPFDPQICPGEVWDRAVRASQRLAGEAARGAGLIARIQIPLSSVFEEFVLAWAEALTQGPPSLALVNTIEVRSLSGKTVGLIVTPAHPLRLAWHAAYDLLTAHARYEDGVNAAQVNRVLASLDSAHFPAVLPGLDPEQGFVFGDTLGFHAVAMVADRDPEPKAAIAQMAACLADGRTEVAPSVGARTADVLACELRHYLACHGQIRDGKDLRPNLLILHAHRAGDGMTVARALGNLLDGLPAADVEDEDSTASDDLCFALDLLPTPEQTMVSGRFLGEVARRHRSGAGQVERRDRWLLETVQRPGGVVVPRLRWARRTEDAEIVPAHVALTFNNFISQLETTPSNALSVEPRPIHAYGLVAPFERHVSFDAEPTWRLFVPPRSEGHKHPAGRAFTDRLGRLHEAVLRATARHLGGDANAWPVLATRLSREARDRIDKLHRSSDWVVSVDRNACVEYFDSPSELGTVYDTYVIDCVAERDDLGSLQLVTSTTKIEEVRALLDRVLAEMGLSASERNCRMLLDHLKALSGRLAIRLANPATRAGELVALALVHAHCRAESTGNTSWPRLDQGFLLPLDEVADIVPLDASVPNDGQRTDLLYVSSGPRGPLELRFVEVKYRRHLRTARVPQLIAQMRAQLAAMRGRWKAHFLADNLGVSGRAIRRSALARILAFYLDRARRHHLDPTTYQRLRRQIDKLLSDGDGYGEVISEQTDLGFVFCPELRTAQLEPIGDRGNKMAEIYLFGPTLLPEVGAGGIARVSGPASGSESAPKASITTDGDMNSEERAAAPSTRSDSGVEGSTATGEAVQGPVTIRLGSNIATGEAVNWRVSIKGNPHLMVLGLPGMGKTTSLVSICGHLATAGINPIIFSYHHDIDERLTDTVGGIEFVDYQGLGFNPLQVDPTSPVAHIDIASELRDIFAAIFRDLGDLQTEEIRQAIKQSFADMGWGNPTQVDPLSVPSFQTFFNILTAKPKPNAGLVARLNELNDYGFFSAAGQARSLLDLHRPVIVRIHRTSNDLLQRAFASFVLYSIYKDMFRRGLQKRLTHAVVFDEAHRASRLKLLPIMAKECRKYGLSLIVASQEARDFDSSLYAAIASYLALRVTEYDARVIAKLVSVSATEARVIDRLKQLPKFQGLYFTEGETRPVQVALSMSA